MVKEGQVMDFTLFDQEQKEFRLADFRGHRVLLSFHPLAWTSVCTDQMRSLEDHWSDFLSLDTVAVGISVDSIPCKKAWSRSLRLEKTRLLSDFWPHGKVAQDYGVFRQKEGFSERANIIIDIDGQVVYSKIYPIRQLPDVYKILGVLRNLP
jgi:peroxiredoxin